MSFNTWVAPTTSGRLTFDAADAVVREVELAQGDERVEPLDALDEVAVQLQQLEPPQPLQMLDVLHASASALLCIRRCSRTPLRGSRARRRVLRGDKSMELQLELAHSKRSALCSNERCSKGKGCVKGEPISILQGCRAKNISIANQSPVYSLQREVKKARSGQVMHYLVSDHTNKVKYSEFVSGVRFCREVQFEDVFNVRFSCRSQKKVLSHVAHAGLGFCRDCTQIKIHYNKVQ